MVNVMIIKKIICKMKGHTLVEAGSCPFTGMSYDACTRCNSLLTKNDIIKT